MPLGNYGGNPFSPQSPVGNVLNKFSLTQQLYQGAGNLFGLGGDGHDPNRLADLLRSMGLGIPGGMNARAFGKAQVLSQLLGLINQPTGLENFYGPEFQTRATGSALAQSSAPFAEAGRALTSSFLRGGGTGAGSLTRARGELASGEGMARGNAISNLLLDLEGRRAGNVQAMEGIRMDRLAMLANFLNRIQAGHAQGRAQGKAEDASTGQAIGAGIGSLLPLLALLCRVAEALFGPDDERTRYARLYMGTMAPEWLREGYREHAPEIVEALETDPTLRKALVPLFEWFAAQARDACPVIEEPV